MLKSIQQAGSKFDEEFKSKVDYIFCCRGDFCQGHEEDGNDIKQFLNKWQKKAVKEALEEVRLEKTSYKDELGKYHNWLKKIQDIKISKILKELK